MIEICVELALCVGEQGKIKFLLFGAKVVPANNDSTRWQSQVIGLLELRRIGKVNKHLWLEDLMVYLRPAEHHTIEQNLQLLERISTRALHAVLLDGRKDFRVPKTSLESG